MAISAYPPRNRRDGGRAGALTRTPRRERVKAPAAGNRSSSRTRPIPLGQVYTGTGDRGPTMPRTAEDLEHIARGIRPGAAPRPWPGDDRGTPRPRRRVDHDAIEELLGTRPGPRLPAATSRGTTARRPSPRSRISRWSPLAAAVPRPVLEEMDVDAVLAPESGTRQRPERSSWSGACFGFADRWRSARTWESPLLEQRLAGRPCNREVRVRGGQRLQHLVDIRVHHPAKHLHERCLLGERPDVFHHLDDIFGPAVHQDGDELVGQHSEQVFVGLR